MDEPSTCWQNAIAPSLEASLACLCDCKSTAEGTFYRISPSRVRSDPSKQMTIDVEP